MQTSYYRKNRQPIALFSLTKGLFICLLFTFSSYVFAADTYQNVRMITNKGTIDIALNSSKAPITVKNFLSYVNSGFYEGLIFHRVIPNFMIQGGGFDQQLNRQQTQSAIQNESTNGLNNRTGTIAMARTSDPNSATSQFFINVANNLNLDGQAGRPGYAVFGEVTQGLDIVMQISREPTRTQGRMQNVPITPIIIERILVLDQ